MHPIHTLLAGYLSLAFWFVPEPDYWQMAFEQTMRSNVLPYVS